MKTYEITTVEVKHPEKGLMTKQQIIYYENAEDKGTPEYYDETVEIRNGYTEKK